MKYDDLLPVAISNSFTFMLEVTGKKLWLSPGNTFMTAAWKNRVHIKTKVTHFYRASHFLAIPADCYTGACALHIYIQETT